MLRKFESITFEYTSQCDNAKFALAAEMRPLSQPTLANVVWQIHTTAICKCERVMKYEVFLDPTNCKQYA